MTGANDVPRNAPTLPAGHGQVDPPVRPLRIPTRTEIDALMKRCQIGVGGRTALDDAHDIMSDCYGTLGLLMQCVEWLRICNDRMRAQRDTAYGYGRDGGAPPWME